MNNLFHPTQEMLGKNTAFLPPTEQGEIHTIQKALHKEISCINIKYTTCRIILVVSYSLFTVTVFFFYHHVKKMIHKSCSLICYYLKLNVLLRFISELVSNEKT